MCPRFCNRRSGSVAASFVFDRQPYPTPGKHTLTHPALAGWRPPLPRQVTAPSAADTPIALEFPCQANRQAQS
jgi:hypothetical protein